MGVASACVQKATFRRHAHSNLSGVIGKIPNARSCRVIDSVGHRCCDAGDWNLAQAPSSDSLIVDVWIWFIDEEDLDSRNVCVYRTA